MTARSMKMMAISTALAIALAGAASAQGKPTGTFAAVVSGGGNLSRSTPGDLPPFFGPPVI